MKRSLLLAFFVLMFGLLSFARQISENSHKTIAGDNKEYKFTAGLSGGIYINNNAAWILEPSITWNFYKYIGLRAGVEITREYHQSHPGITIDGWHGDLNKNYENVGWIILKPGLVFKTPSLIRSRDGSRKLWIQAEPGVSLACPFNNSVVYDIQGYNGNIGTTVSRKKFPNKDLQWFYWYGKLSINFSIEEFVFGGGFGISNLDYYSCRRNIALPDGRKFQVPGKEMSRSIFLMVGYNF